MMSHSSIYTPDVFELLGKAGDSYFFTWFFNQQLFCRVSYVSDGDGRCIIDGLGQELIKENSLVSVTCHFKVAEYFKTALFLRGNEI